MSTRKSRLVSSPFLRYTSGAMDEGRKRVLLIAASILAARKLSQFEGNKRAARESDRDERTLAL